MNKSKVVLLAVSTMLAMAFTGCGTTKPDVVESPRSKLVKLCNKEFIEKNYCGVGVGRSTTESMAAQVAMSQARENLASNIKTSVTAQVKRFAMNSPDGVAMEGMASRSLDKVKEDITDLRTQEEVVTKEADGKFVVYTLITTSREPANNSIKSRMNQEIAATRTLQVNVDAMFDGPIELVQ